MNRKLMPRASLQDAVVMGLAIGAAGGLTTAAAQESTAALETIVVTATKRTEDMQDVPVAVSAITAKDLESRGITETSDLMGAVPNLQVTSAYGRTQPNFSLRGISVANEFSAATASPVGVYVDEVYQSFRASHGQQLYDLERVEVLRGPQGTLFGRNTTGGAVNFYTRTPALKGAEGTVTAGYGNFSAMNATGALEFTPVADELGIRIAGSLANADGYIANPVDGKDYAEIDSRAARLVARFKPTDNFDSTLKLYWAENKPLGDLAYGIGYLQNGMSAVGYSRAAVQPGLGRVLREDEVQSDTAGTYYTASKGASLNLEHRLTPDVALTSITGFDSSKYRLSPFDCDGSPVNVCAIRYYSQSDNFNQDLRISFDSSRFKLIGGLYYGKDSIDTHNEPDFFNFLSPLLSGAGLPGSYFNPPIASTDALSVLPAFALNPGLTPASPGFCDPVNLPQAPGRGPGFFDARSLLAYQYDVAATNSPAVGAAQAACAAAGAPPFAGITVDQTFTIERPSWAVYGEGKWQASDRFAVTLGLRYTRDDVDYSNSRAVIKNLGGADYASLVPYSLPLNSGLPAVAQSESTEEVSGRLIADFRLTDSVMTYASYSHGYRAGTYNALAYQAIEQVYFVEPETVNAFEVGLKSRFWNDRVQLNAAAFYYDYKNQQIAEIVGATSFLRNANGEVKGAEAELTVQATYDLRIDASLGLLDTRYDDNQRFRPDGLDIGGNEFPNAPNTMANLGFEWRAWGDSARSLTVRGDAQHMGSYWFDPYNDYGQPVSQVNGRLASTELARGNPGYTLYNARIQYETDRYAVSLWGKNLSDKFYWAYGLNLNAFYLDYFSRGVPRTYGVEATFKF